MKRVHKINKIKLDTANTVAACSTLRDLPAGKSGRVVRLNGPHEWRRRLAELGIVPGTTIRVIRTAPLGGPILIALGDCRLSMHGSEARRVELKSIASNTPAEDVLEPGVESHGKAVLEPAAPVSMTS